MSKLLRHLLTYTLIVAVWASSSGFSLVAIQMAGQWGTAANANAYPCAGHDCGCVSPQMCRTQCPCSPVEPEPSTCCEQAAASSCCDTAPEPCQDETGQCPIEPTDPAPASPARSPQEPPASQPTLQPLQCAGFQAWIIAQQTYITLSKPPEIQIFRLACARRFFEPADIWFSRSHPPESPPPRF